MNAYIYCLLQVAFSGDDGVLTIGIHEPGSIGDPGITDPDPFGPIIPR